MTKTSKKISITLLAIIMALISVVAILFVPNRAFAAAADSLSAITWQDECAEFTSHEKFNINGTEHTMRGNISNFLLNVTLFHTATIL